MNNLIGQMSSISPTKSPSKKKLKKETEFYVREHLVATERRNSGAPIITDHHEWLVSSPLPDPKNDPSGPKLARLENIDMLQFHGIHIGSDTSRAKFNYTLLSGRTITNISANKYIPSESPVFQYLYLLALADLAKTTTKRSVAGGQTGLSRFFHADDLIRIRTFVNQIHSRLSNYEEPMRRELIELLDIVESGQ
jgi:hypothetical protein